MTDPDHRREQGLRAQAKTGDSAAELVLSDFYELRGQLSRARLWRTVRRLRGRHETPADLVVRDPKWRRKVMMWLLGHVIGTAAVARAFKSSPSWAATLKREVTREICLAANAERHCPTLAATQRLQAAGALPKPFESGAFEFGEVPPESWPVTPRTAPTKAPPRRPITEEDLHRMARAHETNKRFAVATGYRPGHKLDPSDPQDAKMIPIWLRIHNDVKAEGVRASVPTQHFVCRACGAAHFRWHPRCPSCLSLEGLDRRSDP